MVDRRGSDRDPNDPPSTRRSRILLLSGLGAPEFHGKGTARTEPAESRQGFLLL
jgi:hypothetical protein